MTDDMQAMLLDRLDKAREKKDVELIVEALCSMGKATMNCQVKTGERIKKVEFDVTQIRVGVDAIQRAITEVATSRAKLTEDYRQVSKGLVEVKDEIRSWKERANGMKMLWDFLKFAAGAGGGVYIAKALGV